ncbi:hypothetical protein L226DRAFT_532983 [Lentinus tigrinus ALCF2SS1-7]|uniref:uncharacterized protein n=1 Tax=Lentinus tigrinus ALCF2SS1-7 TaxID=1328758 RepID=UPI001165DE23|nr:hypothetical protein L226DRAFT_532983 [Lentinus tigrinus ALCF2SS1-7]
MATTTQTAPMMTIEVPVVTGDVLRAIDTPAVPPPSLSPPPAVSTTTTAAKKIHRRMSSSASEGSKTTNGPGHRRSSSAASDMAKAAGIDIEAVSMAEARKIMSEEHKILGFRPPHGSFAAEVQSMAAKHPDGKPGAAVDTGKLKEIAREDALRILAERKTSTGADKDALPVVGTKTTNGNGVHTAPARHSPPNPGVNLNTISAADARVLMSHEHKALGFRPPPGSLAAEAQSAAARHPEGDGTHFDDDTLRDIAFRDAERIKADRELNMIGEINVSAVGKEGASEVQSAEDKALGHSAPSGSLAAEAQSAGDKHPQGGTFDPTTDPVALEAVKDAARKEGEELRAAESTSTAAPAPEKEETGTQPESAVQTEPITEEPPSVVRGVTTPPLNRTETADSVEIVCDVLA